MATEVEWWTPQALIVTRVLQMLYTQILHIYQLYYMPWEQCLYLWDYEKICKEPPVHSMSASNFNIHVLSIALKRFFYLKGFTLKHYLPCLALPWGHSVVNIFSTDHFSHTPIQNFLALGSSLYKFGWGLPVLYKYLFNLIIDNTDDTIIYTCMLSTYMYTLYTKFSPALSTI